MKLFQLLALCALLTASPAWAETPSIGVVNIQKIMRDSTAAKSVRDQLQGKQRAFQTDLDAKEKALQAEDQALVKERDKISKEALEQKVNAFRQKAMTARNEIQNKRVQLDKGFQGALAQIQSATLGIVAEVAKEKGLSLMLSSSQVLYATTGMDVTDEVLARLNKKLPSVAVKF